MSRGTISTSGLPCALSADSAPGVHRLCPSICCHRVRGSCARCAGRRRLIMSGVNSAPSAAATAAVTTGSGATAAGLAGAAGSAGAGTSAGAGAATFAVAARSTAGGRTSLIVCAATAPPNTALRIRAGTKQAAIGLILIDIRTAHTPFLQRIMPSAPPLWQAAQSSQPSALFKGAKHSATTPQNAPKHATVCPICVAFTRSWLTNIPRSPPARNVRAPLLFKYSANTYAPLLDIT